VIGSRTASSAFAVVDACRLEVSRDVIQKRFATGGRLAPFIKDTLCGLLILALEFSGNAESVKEVTH